MLRSSVSQSFPVPPEAPPPPAAAEADDPPLAPELGVEVGGTEEGAEGGGAAGGAMVPTLDKGLSPTFSLTKLVLLGGLEEESRRF